ncbi:MAG: 50S ribosomal protein L10 [Candidatus Latescibacterota bacterium]|nr:MAG: 50S ribosomal protein L10 [Candidatus Latescibacterota bacterium]
MPRPEKIKKIEELAQLFNEARSIVLNDFTGLDVEKISELRKQCRESNVEYRVIKNTLALRSLEGTPGEGLEQYFEGPTALAVSRESENLSAKVLAKFAEEYEAPVFKAAVVDGNVIDATEVLALAKLPERDQLMSAMLGAIKSPGNSLVSVLQGTVRNLLYVVNAIIEKKQSEPAGGEAAPEGEGSE